MKYDKNEARQAQIDDLLQKKRDSLRRNRSRATQSGDEQRKWTASFDLERLSKGLIEVHETHPFVDCESVQEYLHTSRMFAHALRQIGTECPDITSSETKNDFILRIHKAWYSSVQPGEIFHFVQLSTSEFDDDLGYKRNEPFDWSSWIPVPGAEVTLTAEEIAALPVVGLPDPEWKKAGFSYYADWKEHKDAEDRKAKNKALLESGLRTREEINRDLNPPTVETKTPQLLYRGIITEH
jgi:hypothetical protein